MRNASGYACSLKTMVGEYRKLWSAIEGTTPPDAPFGIATLPYWSAEGSPQNVGAENWAHTANHGVFVHPSHRQAHPAQHRCHPTLNLTPVRNSLPNADLPNTFLASGHDIGECVVRAARAPAHAAPTPPRTPPPPPPPRTRQPLGE